MEPKDIDRKIKPGTAYIKAEYLAVDRVRHLNLEFVTEEDKSRVVKSSVNVESTEEPPRKKLKGQNKHRPRDIRVPKSEKLCFKIGTGGVCPYDTGCVYSHDIESYLAKKPADIGDKCYLFDRFGRCPYGFSCRFGSAHIINGKNICNEDVWNKIKDERTIFNTLTHELQISLRKKKYDFVKSEKVVKLVESGQWRENFKYVRKDQDISGVDEKHATSDICQLDQKILPVILVAEDGPGKYLDNNKKNSTLHGGQDKSIAPSLNVDKTIVSSFDEDQFKGSSMSEDKLKGSSLNEDKLKESSLNGDKPIRPSLNEDKPIGPSLNEDIIQLKPCEIKKVDFRNKLYLAPLTTVGNLPFRRICKEYGADITCGEMAVAQNILQGQPSEWALLKRHHTEDIFGVQLCGNAPQIMTRCTQMLSENLSVDFIDVNMGCPLEFICKMGSGCGLMGRMKKLENIIYAMSSVSQVPITLKMRTGIHDNTKLAHTIVKNISYLQDNIGLLTIHGRSREQRYTKSADWEYIKMCNEVSSPVPLFGNGDVLSYEDYNLHQKESNVHGIMIARGALIKPWIFTEIKEQRHWDISSTERLDCLKSFANYGLEHWGSDSEGVAKTRRFLLEWLSFLYRYIPVGLLERVPQRINERPPPYFGRNDLETLMASPSCRDWVKISEMLLGPVPENFEFLPKHKANAYS